MVKWKCPGILKKRDLCNACTDLLNVILKSSESSEFINLCKDKTLMSLKHKSLTTNFPHPLQPVDIALIKRN